jgi:hypothetical protein
MWPTFYIPGVPVLGALTANSAVLCGLIGGPAYIPTHPSAQEGDIQIVLIDYISTPSGLPDFDSGGIWRLISDALYQPTISGGSYGTNQQQVYWRTYHSGDPDFHFTGGTIYYASVIVRNQNTADPLMIGYLHRASIAMNGFRIDGAIRQVECADPGDLVVVMSAPSDITDLFYAANEPSSLDVKWACTGNSTLTSPPGTSGTMFGYEPTSVSEANNLLTYCPSLDSAGWTYVGVTTTPLDFGDGFPGALMKGNVGSTKHYAEQSVTLTAGKTYLFCVQAESRQSWGYDNACWITMVKPDNTEHGVGEHANTRYSMSGSTDVVWGGAGKPGASARVSDTIASQFGQQLSFMVTAASTGTYKFRIHTLPIGGDPTGNYAGSSLNWLYVQNVCLQEGPSVNQAPTFVKTGSAAVARGSVPYLNLPFWNFQDAMAGNMRDYTYLVVRRAGGKRPLCKLFGPAAKGVIRSYGDNTIYRTGRRIDIPVSSSYEGIGTSHCVGDHLSNKRFYFELSVDSFGTGGAQKAYSLGFCPFPAIQDMMMTQLFVGDSTGQYVYCADGNTYVDGTADSAITGWSVGDNIGVGIDFTAFTITFYRNGTLLKTCTITSGVERHMLWSGLTGVFSSATEGYEARFTYNFQGPFSGRKPSGYVAFDFDNEIP